MRALLVLGLVSFGGCAAPRLGLCGDSSATAQDVGRQLVALEDVSPFTSAEHYRLIYAPSFKHVSVVRISSAGALFKGAAAFRKICPGEARVVSVDADAWSELTRLIDASGFWEGEQFASERHVMDGELWMLEGVRGAESRAVEVHASTLRGLFLPPRYSALAAAFERMMAMSDAPLLWFARD